MSAVADQSNTWAGGDDDTVAVNLGEMAQYRSDASCRDDVLKKGREL
jgi:hypothetical protein